METKIRIWMGCKENFTKMAWCMCVRLEVVAPIAKSILWLTEEAQWARWCYFNLFERAEKRSGFDADWKFSTKSTKPHFQLCIFCFAFNIQFDTVKPSPRTKAHHIYRTHALNNWNSFDLAATIRNELLSGQFYDKNEKKHAFASKMD